MRSTIKTATASIAFGLVIMASAGSVGAFLRSGDQAESDNGVVDIEKFISIDGGAWQDADLAPGPEVADGSLVDIRYVVTNLSADRWLLGVTLTDDVIELPESAIPTSIFPGWSVECVVGPQPSAPGQHTSTGMVSALAMGTPYADSDPVNFYCVADGGEEPPGVAGVGFWRNHPEAWPVDEITVGGLPYFREDAIDLMGGPTQGDKS